LYDITANTPGGYSYPSGIVRGVQALGLKAEVYIRPSKGLTFLTGRFSLVRPGLIDRERRALDEMGVRIHDHRVEGVPGHNERGIQCLSVLHILGLHWVMVRPNGSVMDPGTRTKFDSIEEQERQLGGVKLMQRTGLTVVVSC